MAEYNRRLRHVVAALSEEQLAMQPSPERWPLWATVGHTACQRVFWLCDFAREPGVDTTRFTNATYNCPGDDDLENVLSAKELVAALDSTFRIVENCLDRWTLAMLDEEIRREDFGPDWVHLRGLGPAAGLQPRRLALRRAQRVAERRTAAGDRLLGLRRH
ncbi:MAG: DinB family protein [Candidatus Limnocylindria bacterium]